MWQKSRLCRITFEKALVRSNTTASRAPDPHDTLKIGRMKSSKGDETADITRSMGPFDPRKGSQEPIVKHSTEQQAAAALAMLESKLRRDKRASNESEDDEQELAAANEASKYNGGDGAHAGASLGLAGHQHSSAETPFPDVHKHESPMSDGM
ncbi:hypothetical protein WJX73_005096 [Symbiochloris irregularis]|uniref:Uncharacterized protein n=1 Tax=Symbiochloris irregularis TaxID=706552 RepID=A0AAW1PLM0_9CHLO